MIAKKKNTFIMWAVLIGLVAFLYGVHELSYQWSYRSDLKNKPWAYSKDKDAKLLVGKWQGSFKDPNDVDKTITIEIFEPMTDAERREKAGDWLFKPRARRSISYHKRQRRYAFEGVAMVVSNLGTEEYKLSGKVQAADFAQLSLGFMVKDETQRLVPNFGLFAADKGHWQTDNLQLTISFAYFKADGSSFWDSSDARHEKLATVNLHRK